LTSGFCSATSGFCSATGGFCCSTGGFCRAFAEPHQVGGGEYGPAVHDPAPRGGNSGCPPPRPEQTAGDRRHGIDVAAAAHRGFEGEAQVRRTKLFRHIDF